MPACGDDASVGDTDGETDTDPTTSPTGPTGPTGPTTDPTEGDSSSTTDMPGDGSSSSGERDTDTDTDTGGTLGPVAIWTTANPAGRDADRVTALAPALDGANVELPVAGEVLGIQSLAIANGDGWASFDGNGENASGLMFLPDIDETSMDGTIGLGQRLIRGSEAGLVSPKGVFITPNSVVVADVGAGNIKGFSRDAVEGDGPTWVIDDLGSSDAVWDIHYDLGLDMLFAAGTNGELQVYENFAADLGADGPDRTIIPTLEGTQVSVNLHGVATNGGALYLTDVGDAMVDDDGQIFVIEDAATAMGMVEVDQQITGNMLGNPVDLEVRSNVTETVLFVAEKANSTVITFARGLLDDGFTGRGTVAVAGAESVALTAASIFATANPGGFDGDQALRLIQPIAGGLAIENTLTTPGSVSSQQSVHLMASGEAWITVDGPATGGGAGVAYVENLPGFAGEALDLSAMRIWGDQTGLVAPKGLDVASDGSMVFVADVGTGDIRVFAGDASNDAPMFVLDAGEATFWDVEYDDASDRVYASGTDGVVYVFDDVGTDQGDAVARMITPTDGTDVISVNLHGIQYDAVSDVLMLTDVGDAGVADDGQIFAIADAAEAEGMTEVALRIAGASTGLGNPVDLAFDGVDLYVAEKANSMVLRYDGVLALAGEIDAAADASIEVVNAESVQVQAR